MKNLKNLLNDQLIWAFNINDLLEIKAVMKATAPHNKPVIILISSNAIDFSGLDHLDAITKVAKKISKGRLFVQLDHGKDEVLIMECARRGFDALMIDASDMNYEDNIRHVKQLTSKIKKISNTILVEAELGVIGDSRERSRVTSPGQVKDFISETGVDLLAVSIGNQHGFNKRKPSLDRLLLEKIHEQSEIPLVLHGGDWASKEDIKFAVQNGIRKINVGPELRLIIGETIKDFVNSRNNDITDHRKLIGRVVDNLAEAISEKLQLF